jgi:cobalt-zinc-cadmium efflux system outer membrane protein
LGERLKVPADLPGGTVPPIRLPPLDPHHPKEREAAMNRLYPELPAPPPEPPLPLGPEGKPLSLSDLQRLAVSNNPRLRQAVAQVEVARGAALQAGLYPNPTVGYEADTMGTASAPGYQGGFVEQDIITAGKLQLAQSAALVDLRNAELALRATQADLLAQVRAGYFGVLVARERLRIARTLAIFTYDVYRIQVEQVRGAQAAAYEPLQLRVLAMQARGNWVQAHNRAVSAWKQLAASLGLPALPPTQLEGRVDMPIPRFDYDNVLTRVLQQHTDVLTAENAVQKARYQLRLAQVKPVPDIGIRVLVQKDYTTAQSQVTPSVTVGVPLPVWDRNQGGIIQAQGGLIQAQEESHRVRIELTAKVADAYERYENNRVLLDYYRQFLLPDQVRSYRGAYNRHQQEPDRVDFGAVVNAQQILAQTIEAYVATLSAQWDAVVELSRLLQTADLFQTAEREPVAAVPDLREVAPLPCCHPCSPLPGQEFQGKDGVWPPADPSSSRLGRE